MFCLSNSNEKKKIPTKKMLVEIEKHYKITIQHVTCLVVVENIFVFFYHWDYSEKARGYNKTSIDRKRDFIFQSIRLN